MPEWELLERVEAVAASGDRRAATILRRMVRDRLRTGEIHLFHRLMCTPYFPGEG
jgi:hypothetical protein